MKRTFLIAILVLGALITPLDSRASDNNILADCASGVCFQSLLNVQPFSIPLIGRERYRYYVFDVYDIALYAPPEKRTINEILSDIPKSLVLHYHRGFTPEQITQAADKILMSNPAVNYREIELQLIEINKLYQEVKPGDRYQLLYQPNIGTSLLFNNTIKGTVSGAEFAKAYFGIWLSDYPISASLRDALILGSS